jgi:hypothetical protein
MSRMKSRLLSNSNNVVLKLSGINILKDMMSGRHFRDSRSATPFTTAYVHFSVYHLPPYTFADPSGRTYFMYASLGLMTMILRRRNLGFVVNSFLFIVRLTSTVFIGFHYQRTVQIIIIKDAMRLR